MSRGCSAEIAERGGREHRQAAAVKIRARKVSVFYGEKQALFDVDLDVGERMVTALIGPSGCGKSTFLRCLNRMNDTIGIARITGKIALDGDDIYASGIDVVELRARVGMVFQKPNPVPEVDLRERRLRSAHPRPRSRQDGSAGDRRRRACSAPACSRR